MTCDFCGAPQAAIHLERHDPQGPKKLNICLKCAEARGLSPQNMKAETLNNLFDESIEIKRHKAQNNTCKSCGTSEIEIKEQAMLGCGNCYDVFSFIVEEQIKNMQIKKKYLGKSPKRLDFNMCDITPEPQTKSLSLEEKMAHAIVAENYELAAELRDRLQNEARV